LTNQPDRPQPVSGQPWPTPSGDPLSPEPYQPPRPASGFTPGQAAIPPHEPDYPPTSQFPAQPPVNYAPPGYRPDYGHSQGGYAGGGGAGGYGGGYPPPGYPPPGYPPPGFAPPQPPPRKSNAPIVAVIIAVTLLLCGGVATAGVMIARNVADKAKEATAPLTDLPTEVPDLPGLPTGVPTDGSGHKITVTYEVDGDGPVSIVYVEKLGETPVRLSDVKLPWKFTAEMQTPTLVSVVAVRVATSEGSVSCRALVDGEEVKKVTSNPGNFATASCAHLAVD
jgi:hypothetical protein